MTFFVLHSYFYSPHCMYVVWVISRLFFEHYQKENAKAGREKKNWVKMVGGRIPRYTFLSWPLARLWISSTVD